MDIFATVKRAWEIVRTRRWLWGLGLLAAITESGGFDLSNKFDFDKTDWNKYIHPTATPSVSPSPAPSGTLTARVLGDSIEAQRVEAVVSTVGTWLTDHAGLLLGLAAVLVVIFLVLLYLSYVSRAGLIKSVRAIEDHDKDLGFRAAFRAGVPYAAKLFGLQIYSAIIALITILAIMVIFGAPLFFTNNNATTATVLLSLWMIIGIVMAIIATYGIGMAYRYGEQQMVVNESGVVSSFATGLNVVQQHVKQSVMSSLAMAVISIIYGILLGIILVPVVLLLAGLGFGIYTAGGVVATVTYGIIVLLLLIAACWIVGGMYTSFVISFWTLVFKQLTAKHKGGHKAEQATA